MNIRNVCDFDTMLQYFGEKLEWNIDTEDFDSADYTYDVYADELGIKKEELATTTIYQLRPFCDGMPFGVFAVSFESKKLEKASLRKILSGLVRKKRDEHLPEWNMHDLLFLCFWGEKGNEYVGVACFDDNDKNLPQLKIEYIQPASEDTTQISNFESKLAHLKMPADTSDADAWKAEWKRTFSAVYHQQITDSKKLAHELALLAQHTRDTIISTYNVETGLGYVHLLFKKFQDNLVHDLTVEQFADMYAQTIAYGLFSAKCMDNNEHFDWKDAIDKIPNTNPFLKTLIKSCFEKDGGNKIFFDELELAEIIKLLDNTNISNILEHFNRHTGGGREDTVIYFYEDFLSEYEHDTKKRRGVYYTPWPVVKFMVRAVDDILKTEFGFKDGLADTATKVVNIKRDSKRKNRNGVITQVDDTETVPAIQILDPATGTGTFLREVILHIYETFRENNKGKSEEEIKKLWNEYVPTHLLKRINGFELMMAPYAVAHMKLAMVLKDTGYDFESDERLNVLLTNSLEPSDSDASFMEQGQQISFFNDPLAAEAYEADKAKNNPGINVIIGNPPYSGVSSNNNEYISKLIDDYKYIEGEYFNERKHWLNDDYVKFIRYSEEVISKNGNGVLAFINNHGFLDNPTFRCMRYHLLKTFDTIYIIDLHGNIMRKEVAPNGERDENVFDIMQGVSINIFVKNSTNPKKDMALVEHCDVLGTRHLKYETLLAHKINYAQIVPTKPYYFFVKRSENHSDLYNNGFIISDLMKVNVTGIVSMGDTFAFDENSENLFSRIQELIEGKYTIDSLNENFGLGKNYAEFVYGNKNNLLLARENIQKISYRPFDDKYTYFDNKILWRPRTDVMNHMIKDNIAIIVPRQAITDNWSHVGVSKNLVDNRFHYSNKGIPIVCPLYLYSEELGKTVRTPNLNPEIVKEISEKLGLPFAPDSDGGKTDSFAPIDLLDYIYAVLHSPKYRETYKEFLKIDFPRVPYPTDIDMFWKMVELGGQIRRIHLMEADVLNTPVTTYPVDGENEVTKPAYKNGKVYINKEQYFDGVPELAWNFYIGGYQPLQKWLKDRKGRKLSDEDIAHYQKIVVALTETDRLMKEIDEVFEF
ncbi:MAG: DNA methyltransferase [Ruminococcus sp.]|nr:DNA methyltransferase [Ruminococcus sp.]